MDWFLYDNGLRHERVKYGRSNSVQNRVLPLITASFEIFLTLLMTVFEISRG